MESLNALIDDLDQLVKRRSRAGQKTTFKQVAGLYFASVDLQLDEHIEFFGNAFNLLVDQADINDLVDLGQRIARVRNAPVKLIRRLANDDQIAVAGPVIAQSECLTSDDLVMLAQTKSQAHLDAISDRPRLDADVTSILVERADGRVIKKVARNAGATFSTEGFAHLAQRALQDEELAESVGTRSDIPPGVLRALVAQSTEGVRARILQAASAEMKPEIASAMGSGSGEALDFTVARQRMAALRDAGRLGEREIVELARDRRLEETLAALELRCGAPAEVIRRFIREKPAELVPVVCRAAGLSWTAAEAVLGLCGAAGCPLDDGAWRRAVKNFSKLTATTAARLLRYWFVHGSNRLDQRSEPHDQGSSAGRRRSDARKSVELAGSVHVDDRHLVDVSIEDLSMAGAKLRPLSICQLPDRFQLRLNLRRAASRHCQVRWRTRDHVGVQFM